MFSTSSRGLLFRENEELMVLEMFDFRWPFVPRAKSVKISSFPPQDFCPVPVKCIWAPSPAKVRI